MCYFWLLDFRSKNEIEYQDNQITELTGSTYEGSLKTTRILRNPNAEFGSEFESDEIQEFESVELKKTK